MASDSLNTFFSLNEMKSINHTIDRLYNRASDENAQLSISDFTVDFLSDLSNQIDFDKGNIMFYSYNEKLKAYECSSFLHIGWNEDDVNNYMRQYCHIDDVLPILSTDREIAFINGNIFSSREQTPYFREFVQPAQIVKSIDGNIVLSRQQNFNAILGLFRNDGRADFSQKDFEIVKTYQPHLGNAFEQFLKKRQGGPSEDLFDVFSNIESVCVCVLNCELQLMSFNSTFRFHATAGNTLPLTESPLTKKIQEICCNLKHEAFCKDLQKYGPISIPFNGQTFPLEIVWRKKENAEGRFICLLLTDNFALKLQKFQETYGLSGRECEILDLILQKGLSNEEISSTLFISSSTVKKHLTSAYQKAGVSNQKQLNSLFRTF